MRKQRRRHRQRDRDSSERERYGNTEKERDEKRGRRGRQRDRDTGARALCGAQLVLAFPLYTRGVISPQHKGFRQRGSERKGRTKGETKVKGLRG